MSYLSSQNVQAETIQLELDSQFVNCPTPLENIAALEAIINTQQASGIAQSVSDGSGKVKTIKVTYEQRALESAVTSETAARVCTTTNQTFDNYTTYSIDPLYHETYGEKFSIDELATMNSTFPAFLAKKIAKVVDVIERKVATKSAQELVALYGKWDSAVETSYTVSSDKLQVSTFITAAGKQIDYTALSTIDIALMMTGYCAPAIIVGGTTLYAYGKHIGAGCCSTTGVNIMEMANSFGKAILYDPRVSTALGSVNESLVFQAGSVALIHYNKYNPADAVNASPNYSQFKVNSPRTGLPIDIVINDTCGVISIVGYANTKVVGLPSDMFATGDTKNGVKFVNKILVSNS